jgi:hypothetical protein
VILCGVRWYVANSISYGKLEETMEKRGDKQNWWLCDAGRGPSGGHALLRQGHGTAENPPAGRAPCWQTLTLSREAS